MAAVNRAGPNASPHPLLPSSPTISTSMAPRRSYHAWEYANGSRSAASSTYVLTSTIFMTRGLRPPCSSCQPDRCLRSGHQAAIGEERDAAQDHQRAEDHEAGHVRPGVSVQQTDEEARDRAAATRAEAVHDARGRAHRTRFDRALQDGPDVRGVAARVVAQRDGDQ